MSEIQIMWNDLAALLSKGDLRSAVHSSVPGLVKNQQDFDILVSFLDDAERHTRMHAVDAVEKVSQMNPQWLNTHRNFIFEMMNKHSEKEFRWHIAQIVSRLHLTEDEAGRVWDLLSRWLNDKKESRIVRTLSLQAMNDITKDFPMLRDDLVQSAHEIRREKIPSLNARIRKLGL